MSIYLGNTPIAHSQDISGKADVDLSNVNASGTSLASGWSMPSSRYIDLTLGASGATYTAPANGYFYLRKISNASIQVVLLGNASSGDIISSNFSSDIGQYLAAYIPVKKDDIVFCEYNAGGTIQFFRFIYAEGEENV
jgi:hypothetical protein